MAVNTYYFDASDAGPTDPDSVWTGDANAFDGSTGTYASTTTSGAGEGPNELTAEGTNAPSSGGTISLVRVRVHNGDAWNSYSTVTEPGGGWTWAAVQELEALCGYLAFAGNTNVRIYESADLYGSSIGESDAALVSGESRVSRIELEVTSGSPDIATGSSGLMLGGISLGSIAPGQDVLVSGGVELTVDSGLHAHNADNISLTENKTLAVNDATHGHTVDGLVLVENKTLVVAEAIHGHTVNNIELVQGLSVPVNSALHSHAADSIALTQSHLLVVSSATHAHTSDNIDLVEAQFITPNSSIHSHTADNIDLIHKHMLVVGSTSHAHTADGVTLAQKHILVVADGTHTHTADNVVLIYSLEVQNATHDHTADNITLTQKHVLVVASALHALTSDVAEVIKFVPEIDDFARVEVFDNLASADIHKETASTDVHADSIKMSQAQEEAPRVSVDVDNVNLG